MKIFIGLKEIANIADTYARGFRALGHETVTMVWKRNRFYPATQYDIVLNPEISTGIGPKQLVDKLKDQTYKWSAVGYLPQLLRDCDIFLFLYGGSFLPGYLDYRWIRESGKKIVSTFWGDDIRYPYAFEQESRILGIDHAIQPYLDYIKTQKGCYYKRMGTVRAAEKYAHLILSQQGYGQLQSRPYMRANIPIDLGSYVCKIPARERPLIAHAPSDRDIKGTAVILAAIEQLRQEGLQFDFRLIENMPNSDVRMLLTEADIVVDQLYMETIATLSTEAMASGCVALTRYMADYAKIPSDCPAVNINRETIKAELRSLILDLPRRKQIAEAGRQFVEKYYDHVRVAAQILDWLEPGGITEYDYTPQFYQNFRIPADILSRERREALQFWKD